MVSDNQSIPAEKLIDMSDEQIEDAAHERAARTGANEGHVAGGMKAMRTQMKEGEGIGAGVLHHQSTH